jgi:hypothetical protein
VVGGALRNFEIIFRPLIVNSVHIMAKHLIGGSANDREAFPVPNE